MKRRDFLSGVAGASLVGCGASSLPSSQTPATGRDMKAFLATLDGGLAAIDNGNPFGHVLAEAKLTLPRSQTALAEDLYRKNLRSMLLVGSFGDLSESDRAHPEMQARMRAGLPMMDDAIVGTSKYLSSLSADDRAAHKRLLTARPELPMLIAGRLDLEAGKLDISSERRLHLRNLSAHVGWGLQAQQAIVIDDFTDHVRTVASKQNASYLEILQSASVGSSEAPASHGGSTLKVGAIILGIGLGLAAAGGLLIVAAGFVGAFVVTAGAIGVVAGLITLAVGAAINASGP